MTRSTGDRACPDCGAIFRRGYLRCPIDGAELHDFTTDPLEGRTLQGRYVIDHFVGGGANGRVYAARHVRLERRYAVKVLYGDLAADPTMRGRFEREAEAASKLQHPNVVPVIDAELAGGGLCYMVMDFVDGPTLESRLQVEGVWPEERTIEVLRQLASGLEHAHRHGLVHRDLKPDNILFTSADGDHARITDFGVAWVAAPAHGKALTRPGDLVGTPGYMAPEQLLGKAVDARTDLYALGMVGYRMVLGRHPFGGSEVELLDAALDRAVPPLSKLGIESPRLEPVLTRLTERDPDRRPLAAEDVLEALREDRPPRGSPLRPRWLAAAAIVTGLALGVVFAWPEPSPAPPERQPEVVAPRAGAERSAADAPLRPTDEPTGEPPAPEAADAPTPNRETAESDEAPQRSRAEPRDLAPRRRQTAPPEPAPPERRTRAPSATPSETRAPTPTVDELQALYSEVGKRLDALDRAGHPEIEALKTRYFSVPFVRALSDPALRPSVKEQLGRLAREARRASERP